VYGLDQFGDWVGGSLQLSATAVDEHVVAAKTVPSGFFTQPDSEHVSAILFTNSGTQGKITRMAYQTGYGNDEFSIRRFGFAYNPDPNARDPSFFAYDLDQPPFVEPWGQGLVVMHNPNCLIPVPDGFFKDAIQLRLKDGLVRNDTNIWYPMSSRTMTFHLGPTKRTVVESPFHEGRQFVIGAIPRERFLASVGPGSLGAAILYEESGWFADDSGAFYGVVALDKTDQDWGYIVFARDEYFRLRPHTIETSLLSRYSAVQAMRATMIGLLEKPQRLFPDLND
jgi:hypothetical protein